MPLVQRAQGWRESLSTAAVFVASVLVVSSLWGLFVATVGSALYALAGFPGIMEHIMGMILHPALFVAGILMVVIALGELGLIGRLLPELHFVPPVPGAQAGGRYRQVAWMGVTFMASFGLLCTVPP